MTKYDLLKHNSWELITNVGTKYYSNKIVYIWIWTETADNNLILINNNTIS